MIDKMTQASATANRAWRAMQKATTTITGTEQEPMPRAYPFERVPRILTNPKAASDRERPHRNE
jgi:hypothetical protein